MHGGRRTEAAVEIAPNAPPADTQAPPVDTPKRGRPKIHPDRKAYKADHERERRKKAKT